jgi:large repetitive protein
MRIIDRITTKAKTTFNQAPVDFALTDVTAADGTLSNLSGSGTTYTATFTANAGVDDPNATVSVTAGSYHDADGNAGTGGSTPPFTVDTVTPTVTSIAALPSSGDENTGSIISLTVTFDQNVTVTGTPALTLNDEGTAVYKSGSGSNTLVFTYTVGNAQNVAARV